MEKTTKITLLAVVCVAVWFLSRNPIYKIFAQERGENMQITSNAFEAAGKIPKKYTGEGEDISPSLSWKDEPRATESFALIVDDPDAPTENPWVHWVVYNIPKDIHSLAENADIEQLGALQGITDFKTAKYGGPMPPKGHGTHHYNFTLYALDTPKLDLKPGANKDDLLNTIRGRILAQTTLTGTYERK